MSSMEWSALVLAGGRGSRMATGAPKPLVRVGGLPLVEHNVRHAWRAGAREVFVAVHHRAEEIMDHLTKKLPPSIRLEFVMEEFPLGTIGALGRLEAAAPTVLTMNGDLLSAIDLAAMIAEFERLEADGLIATHFESHQLQLGEVSSDRENRLLAYSEKPVKRYQISSGTNVFGARVVELVEANRPLGVPELIERALAAGLDLRVHRSSEAWIDVNCVEDLALAETLYREQLTDLRLEEES